MERDRFFNPEQAAEYGLIDRVIEDALTRRRLAVQLVAQAALAQQRRELLRLGRHHAVDAHVEQ